MAKGDFQRKMANWMSGRQGPDDLAVFCVDVAAIVVIINLFLNNRVLLTIAIVLIVYALFRMFSKNLYKRSQENASFLKALGPARPWFQNPKEAWAEHKAYKHAKCPQCKQRVRVPRNKGTLRVTCPKCHEKFEVNSGKKKA